MGRLDPMGNWTGPQNPGTKVGLGEPIHVSPIDMLGQSNTNKSDRQLSAIRSPRKVVDIRFVFMNLVKFHMKKNYWESSIGAASGNR